MDFKEIVGILMFVVVVGLIITFVTDPTNGIFAKLDVARQNLVNDTDIGSYVPSFALLGKLMIVIAIFIGIGIVIYEKLMNFAKKQG